MGVSFSDEISIDGIETIAAGLDCLTLSAFTLLSSSPPLLTSSNDFELSGVAERFFKIDAGGRERGDFDSSNLLGDFGREMLPRGDLGMSIISGFGGGDIIRSSLDASGFFKFKNGGRGVVARDFSFVEYGDGLRLLITDCN